MRKIVSAGAWALFIPGFFLFAGSVTTFLFETLVGIFTGSEDVTGATIRDQLLAALLGAVLMAPRFALGVPRDVARGQDRLSRRRR